jgi:hypothetical protein
MRFTLTMTASKSANKPVFGGLTMIASALSSGKDEFGAKAQVNRALYSLSTGFGSAEPL